MNPGAGGSADEADPRFLPPEEPTPTAQELGGILAAEKAMISMGWADRCPYVGLGRCQRAHPHPLPHLTDPAAT